MARQRTSVPLEMHRCSGTLPAPRPNTSTCSGLIACSKIFMKKLSMFLVNFSEENLDGSSDSLICDDATKLIDASSSKIISLRECI